MSYCDRSNQKEYPFVLPELPFGKNDFTPHFSSKTFEYHHEKHHNAYVTNLNKLIQDDGAMQAMDLEQIIKFSENSNPGVFNNAAQIWNHSFYWHSIKPNGGGKPAGLVLEYIEKSFGSYEKFIVQFKQAALTQFGSGWAWLVYYDDKLEIVKTSNAGTVITKNMFPLINCDVWEHAYYIDYHNRRPDYVSTFIDHMINWEFAELNLQRAK